MIIGRYSPIGVMVDTFSCNIPMPSLEISSGCLPSCAWQNALVEGIPHTGMAAWSTRVKNLINSRAFWRVVLCLTILLLVVDISRSHLMITDMLMSATAGATAGLDSGVPPGPLFALATCNVDWSEYAYIQYVTNENYLCNSVMIFEALDRVGAKASKLMMYPAEWNVSAEDQASPLIRKARDDYGVQLAPIHIQHLDGEATWADSFTKLLAFNQTQFRRVLSLDSDATVMKSMDELFLLPSAPVAMPRAYWLDDTLSSQLMLVEPSVFEFRRILNAFEQRQSTDFDMEIVNELYGNDCITIPRRKYICSLANFERRSIINISARKKRNGIRSKS